VGAGGIPDPTLAIAAGLYVGVPLAALLLVTAVPLSSAVTAALLVLAVSAGAPMLPRKLAPLVSLLAVVAVPAWVALLARYSGVTVEIPPAEVEATMIAGSILLPLLIGMLLHAALPAPSECVADRLVAVAGVVLTLAGVVQCTGRLCLKYDCRACRLFCFS
jgi:BASS family bile acid:Na+ symporter